MAPPARFEFRFEWDPQKARENARKHGISFERSTSVFRDPNALTIFDRDHAEDEDRWITLGLDREGVPLVVCHTYRAQLERSSVIKVISARKATKPEADQYSGETQS